MSTRLPFALLTAFSMLTIAALIGCNQSTQERVEGGDTPSAKDDYNPHDVPITEEQKSELRDQTAKYADAVAMIKQFRDEIEKETAAGIPESPFKAHQALDKADLVLQWLPEVARNSGVAKEHWETVNTSANSLRTSFEQVHQSIDDKQNPDFAAVADEIDQTLAGLEKVASAQTSDPAPEN